MIGLRTTRWRNRRGALAAVFVALLASTAACDRAAPRLEREFLLFGTSAELTIRGAPPASMAAAADAIERRLAEHDRDWHPWRDSALLRLNEALAAGRSAQTLPTIIDLIARSRPLVRASNGMFDPAAGGLIRAWGFHTGQWPATATPDSGAIAAWRTARPHLDDLQIAGLRVASASRLLQLDFNAIAEGVAAADAIALLRAHGIRHALLDLGGDVSALGDAGGRPWRVALRDPAGGVLGWVELRDAEVLFASGSYAKFRLDQGRRRSHVIDPRSGEPVEGTAATAVLAGDPVLADAGATALMVAGAVGFDALRNGMRLRCALLLTDDDTLHVSRGLQQRLTLLRQPARVRIADGPSTCVDGASD